MAKAIVSAPPSEHPESETQERPSVLAELPRTRPQRPSARRESARKRARAGQGGAKAAAPKAARAAAPKTPATPKAAHAAAKAATTPKTARAAAPKASRRPRTVKPPATPPQGYEADQDLAGTPVAPPSGTEVVAALAELAGELAQNGISTGGRLLKSAISRLTGS